MYHLAHTRNQAAVPVLIAALASPRQEIRLGAIRGLVVRRNPEGHAQVLTRFPTLNDREVSELAATLVRSPHRMHGALRDVLLSDDQRLCDSACRVALMGRVYQLMPTLISVVENPRYRHSAQAGATLVQLANYLHQETLQRPQERTCEPTVMMRQVLPALEESLSRYEEHHRLEIIDAFLLLAPPINELLLRAVRDTTSPCHTPMLNTLATSAVVPILELLTQMLHDSAIPSAALQLIAQRVDRKFLDYLLHNVGSPVSLRVLDNMRKLSAVAWLGDGREALLEIDGAGQGTAIEIARCGCIERAMQLTLLKLLLQQGQPEARRAACLALADFHDRDLNQLILSTLNDPDPRVQAAAVGQLRHRGVHDAMERLVSLLDHSAPEVREAARSSLAEFNFSRYRSSFELMDASTREKIGRLVIKVDPTAIHRLSELLGAPSLSIKLRAMEMVQSMGVAEQLFERVALLIEDPDAGVRTDAAATLGYCDRPAAMELLYRAESDVNPSVREAAALSIEQIADRIAARAAAGPSRSQGF